MNKLSQLILEDRKPDSWDNSFFLSVALWSVRSHDSQTQCGAALVIPCLGCLQMLYQCGVSKVMFSDISDPKLEIYSEKYDQILGLIDDKMEIIYIPKKYLDKDTLECVLKNIKKSNKPLDF